MRCFARRRARPQDSSLPFKGVVIGIEYFEGAEGLVWFAG